MAKFMRGAIYDGQKLCGEIFVGLDLRGCSFRGCNLCGADFTGARLAGAQFDNAIMRGAIFTDADTNGVSFDNADMRGCVVNLPALPIVEVEKKIVKEYWIFIGGISTWFSEHDIAKTYCSQNANISYVMRGKERLKCIITIQDMIINVFHCIDYCKADCPPGITPVSLTLTKHNDHNWSGFGSRPQPTTCGDSSDTGNFYKFNIGSFSLSSTPNLVLQYNNQIIYRIEQNTKQKIYREREM